MWIQTPGVVNDRLMLFGTPKNILYLVKGNRYMLIGGGGQWIVPELERQFRENRIDMDRIQYLLIGHSHYDHCGAVPYLRRRYPHLQVLASREAEKIFSMEKAQRNMRTFSHQVMQEMGLPLEFEGVSLEFDKIHVDRTLEEGNRVDLGSDLSFGVIETPGHSRCSMTLYEPQEKWLFPSDSMAFPVEKSDGLMSTASESFIVYLNSLKKLAALETRLCAWEHFGVMTDGDARDIVRRVIRYTLEYKRRLVEHVGQTGDAEETSRWAARDFLDTTGFGFLPFDVMLHIMRVVVKNALDEQVNQSDYL
jgi:glyoxylase-like metal-dependent hydrolase (beta-lactamase superfamily II)